MLCGGDYDTTGLQGCGSVTALRAVKAGLGTTLCQCRTQQDCSIWAQQLARFLQHAPRNRHTQVPPTFPDVKILNKYRNPTVSTDEKLFNLRGLSNGWDQLPDEPRLLNFTCQRFNIWGKLYMNWLASVLLTKAIVAGKLPQDSRNLLQIKVTPTRPRKIDGPPAPPPLERKITFSAFSVSTFTPDDFQGSVSDFENWKAYYWTNPSNQPFDPEYRVECEMPVFLLSKILPIEVLETPPKTTKKIRQKRSRQTEESGTDAEGTAELPAKRLKSASHTNPALNNGPTGGIMDAHFSLASGNIPMTPSDTKKDPIVRSNDDFDHPYELLLRRKHSRPAQDAEHALSTVSSGRFQNLQKQQPIITKLLLEAPKSQQDEQEQVRKAIQLSLKDSTGNGPTDFTAHKKQNQFPTPSSTAASKSEQNAADWRFSAQASTLHLPSVLSAEAITFNSEASALFQSNRNPLTSAPGWYPSGANELRTARLRHFASSSQVRNESAICSHPKDCQAPARVSQFTATHAAVECIDLTGD